MGPLGHMGQMRQMGPIGPLGPMGPMGPSPLRLLVPDGSGRVGDLADMPIGHQPPP